MENHRIKSQKKLKLVFENNLDNLSLVNINTITRFILKNALNQKDAIKRHINIYK